jgi:hypothetical protein
LITKKIGGINMWVNYDPTAFLEMGAEVKPTKYIYVGKNGNDTLGDGSANYPYLTISKAFSVALTGSTVFTFPGTYAENLTFVSGVSLVTSTKFSVYVTGNHVVNVTGTLVVENIILQSTTGITLTFSGTGVQNFQLMGSSVNSSSGDAINWTNTNAASKIYFEDGTCNVTTSGATARCFYSTTGAAGGLIANRVTFKLDNYANTCLSIGGAVSFNHTSDAVYGKIVVSGTASTSFTMVMMTTTATAVLTTNSSGTTAIAEVVAVTSATPAFDGAGVFAFFAIGYGSTGVGGAATLNGGFGASPLTMAPMRLRAATLLPAGAVAAGLLGGTFEFDGTNLYFTIGTTRSVIV